MLIILSDRSEYSALWRCVKAGGAYFCTQLVKVVYVCLSMCASVSVLYDVTQG